jgi:hypothetical protein
VGGLVRSTLGLSVPDLREHLLLRVVTAVIPCAGNRRADLRRSVDAGRDWQRDVERDVAG